MHLATVGERLPPHHGRSSSERLLAIGHWSLVIGASIIHPSRSCCLHPSAFTPMSRPLVFPVFPPFTAAGVGFALGRPQEQPPANSAPPLKTLEEQAAYAIGLDVGKDVLANFPEVDPNLVARGLIDLRK